MRSARSESRGSLKLYNQKRNFLKTKEPKGLVPIKTKQKKFVFVIQEHHARRLHYDVRLELDGVLKCWAVPKGPSMVPGEKRLAVQTEDHPLAYKDFEGVIPTGEYGAGHMTIWDSGTWIPSKDIHKEIDKGHIEFELKGKRVSGKFYLIRTKGTKGPKSTWLLIKRNDEAVARSQVKKRKTDIDPLPKFKEPQLASLILKPPVGDEWIHEIKFDGYRAIATLNSGDVIVRTRRGHNWTDQFSVVASALKKVRAKSAVIDGEIVAMDETGKIDFQKLQNALKTGEKAQLIYYAFDLLYLNGEDITDRPLLQRKKLLKQLIDQANVDTIRFSQHFDNPGKDILAASCKLNLEGIISKKTDSPYSPGRSGSWLKSKCTKGQEFVIGGFTPPKGSRSGFGALLLGAFENEKFRYFGKVGTGFTGASIAELHSKLKKIVQKNSPFDVASPAEKGVTWVKPTLIANIEYGELTKDKILRHPSFKGLREDKLSKSVKIDSTDSSATEFPLTHPEKILFPKHKITKLRVAEFYDSIQSWMLPLMVDRPLSLNRCPNGVKGQCFFQKHKGKGDPDELHSKVVYSGYKEENEEILYIDSVNGLISLVQMGAFEVHQWGSLRSDIDHADHIVFDLDPDPGVKWPIVRDAAFELRELLMQLELESFVKVTGGKGLHVQVPVDPIYDWDQIKGFSKTVAQHLSTKYPNRFLHQMSKSKRKGKIFLDYLRNGYGATAVSPFSVRANVNASVAMTVSWEDLKKVKSPDMYSIDLAQKILKRRKVDPWDGYLEMKQKIAILTPH